MPYDGTLDKVQVYKDCIALLKKPGQTLLKKRFGTDPTKLCTVKTIAVCAIPNTELEQADPYMPELAPVFAGYAAALKDLHHVIEGISDSGHQFDNMTLACNFNNRPETDKAAVIRVFERAIQINQN